MRRYALLLVVSMLVGALLGYGVPVANAAFGLRFDFAPGLLSAGGVNTVATGWHTSLTSLDLWPSGAYEVYMRGWGFWSGSQLNKSYFLVTAQLSPNNCTRTRADVYEVSSWGGGVTKADTFGGAMLYTHVARGSLNYGFLAHSSTGSWNDFLVGTTLTDENSGCKPTYWNGAHLHQQMDSVDYYGNVAKGTWTRNTRYPDDPNYTLCPGDPGCGTARNNDPTQWTQRLNW